MDQLLRLNRLAAITIAPVQRSTPTKGLEVIYDLIPLDIFVERIALNTHKRINEVTKNNWRGSNKSGKEKSHLLHWDDMEMSLGIDYPDSCLLYTSPSPRDKRQSRMPSSA